MSDPRDPGCRFGGSLLERGTMNCPKGGRPHVGVCAACLAAGGERELAGTPASPEALLTADCIAVCDACRDADCVLKGVSPCARRGMLKRRSIRCRLDKWRLPPPTG